MCNPVINRQVGILILMEHLNNDFITNYQVFNKHVGDNDEFI